MKKFLLIILLSLMICLLCQNVFAYDGKCYAKASILYQPDTGTVLYGDSIETALPIASTTKKMTALIVLENTSINEIVPITSEYVGIEGSSMQLKAGERFTVKELLYGLLLISGNDCAVALACHVAGDLSSFAELMNDRAQSLGCKNTHFVNPHGLDDDEHYSSAYDLALIMSEAMKNDIFAEIVGTKTVTLAGRTLTNHNKLLWSCDGVTGGKTGYTMAAGRILVSSCMRDDMELVCVTKSDKNDWQDHISLYDWGYSNYKLLSIYKSFEIPVISGNKSKVTTLCDDVKLIIKSDDNVDIVYNIPRFIYAPVKAGEKIGTIQCISECFAVEYDIVLAESIENDAEIPLSFWERIKWSWYYYNRHSEGIPYLPRY